MKRTFSYALGVILTMMFVVALFFTSLEYCAFDQNFYRDEYQKLKSPQSIGISEDDLLKVTDHLLGYMRGEKEDLKIKAKIMGQTVTVFDKRDRDHMVDVRDLYLQWANIRNIMAIVIVAGMALIYLLMRREALIVYSKAYLSGTVAMLVLFALVGAWVAIDFNSFWTCFHLLFFTNDLWQLSPETSVLIQMVPQQFFFDIVVRILTLFGCALLALALVCAAVLLFRRRKRKAMMTTYKEN